MLIHHDLIASFLFLLKPKRIFRVLIQK